MAPELLQKGKMTRAADVYSFAMIMVELFTCKRLFEGLAQQQVPFLPLPARLFWLGLSERGCLRCCHRLPVVAVHVLHRCQDRAALEPDPCIAAPNDELLGLLAKHGLVTDPRVFELADGEAVQKQGLHCSHASAEAGSTA